MKGWLVYSPAGYERNRWFAERLIAEAQALGVSLQLKPVPETGEPSSEFFGELEKTPPDFAVMRVIRPDVSGRLEQAGVRCVNNARTARIANDKWRTFELARELSLPVLDTFRFTLPETPQCGFPCVVKSLDGHGGSEVALIGNAGQLADFAAGSGKGEFVAQRMCSCPGRDIRVYALGGETLAAVLRTSETDFRSNFSLGGKVQAVEPTAEQRETVRLLHARLGFDFVGVDFIFHEGRWILNEIEDVVGCRMLYATTGIDVVSKFVRHIAQKEVK